MTPRLSVIAASIRKAVANLFTPIGQLGDYYWDSVSLAMKMNTPVDNVWAKTSLSMHMNEHDQHWASVILAMHMDTDPYWSNVALLLHMDGANDGTTFIDEKGKSVTRAGNAVTKTAIKKFGTASVYFDGTGDYLTTPDHNDFDFGTGDFTLEAWIYIAGNSNPDQSGNRHAGVIGNDSPVTNFWSFFIGGDTTTTGTALYLESITAGVSTTVAAGCSISQNAWHHVALSRANGFMNFFLDGILKSKQAFSVTVTNGTNAVLIGRANNSPTWVRELNGYVDDVRITKGIARYTNSFVPPIKAFPDAKYLDEKGHVFTAVGNTSFSTSVKRFGASSVYFDGAGDYLTSPDHADWDLGTGDFTIEAWIYQTTAGIIIARHEAAAGGVIQFRTSGSDFALILRNDDGTNLLSLYTSGGVSNSVWTHLAASRVSGVVYLFVNGVLKTSAASTHNLNMTDARPLTLGVLDDTTLTDYFAGYVDDVRITKGVGRYTSSFNVPNYAFREPNTTPTFIDELGNPLIVWGAPSLTATNSKFGGMSGSFNGTTDYLSTDSIYPGFGFGTGDFTVEAWVRTGASGTVVDLRNYGPDLGLFCINSGVIALWTKTNYILGTTTLTGSTWFHLAWVRYNGVVTAYVNGIAEIVSQSDGDYGVSRKCTIAADYAGANLFNGLLDEVRITKGIARYIGKFDPAKYANQEAGNGPMFLEETGKIATASGNAVVVTTPKKYGDGSALFDGTGDYLVIPNSTDLQVGATSPFTIELWVNFANLPANYTQFNLVQKGYASASTGEWQIIQVKNAGVDTIGIVTFADGATPVTTSIAFTPAINTWYHLALVRDETTLKLYKDGIQIISVAGSSLYQGSGDISVGANPVGANLLNGYIDNLRITKGLARYTDNFPVPLEITNYKKEYDSDPYWNYVTLAMHMDGTDNGTTFVDEKGHSVTPVGNAVTKTASKMFGTASAYFDGTGDYLSTTSASEFNFGAGNFTIECFVKLSGYSTLNGGTYNSMIVCKDVSGGREFGLQIIGTASAHTTLNFYGFSDNSTGYDSISSSFTFILNRWYHVEVCRVNNLLYMFVNGVLLNAGGSAFTRTIQTTATPVKIGAAEFDATNKFYLNGYIDDLRITKGIGRHTSSFLPVQYAFPNATYPVVQLASDPYWDNVVLAMHMDGADSGTVFTDVKSKTVTPAGNTQTKTATKKFGTASAYFDGTGDYLSIPYSADFELGTGDFTIEAWIYNPSAPANGEHAQVFSLGYRDTGAGLGGYNFRCSTNQLILENVYLGGSSVTLANFEKFGLNKWYHVAVCRDSSGVSFFLNGERKIGSSTFIGTNLTTLSTSNPATVGASGTGSLSRADWAHLGYIDDLRITKGVARYTTDFNPPGAFPEVYAEINDLWSSTVLAMHFDGADNGTVFTDQKGKTITRNGVVTKTAVKKFGTASAYFDGLDNYFTIPDSADFAFGTGDFTIEFWVRPLNTSGTMSFLHKGWTSVYSPFLILMSGGATTASISFYASSNGTSWDVVNGLNPGIVMPIDQWTHIAVTRFGSTFRVFVNGVSPNYVSSSASLVVNTQPVKVGATNGNTEDFQGYLDDLQIIKGAARYKVDFTPPIRAFNNN